MNHIQLKDGHGFSGLPGFAEVISRNKRRNLKRGLPVELSVKELSYLTPGSYKEVKLVEPTEVKDEDVEGNKSSNKYVKRTFKKTNK